MPKFSCCRTECQRWVGKGWLCSCLSLFSRFFGMLVDRGLLAGFIGMRVYNPFHLNRADDSRIVEFSSRDEAQNAIQTLSNTTFMNRQIFVREVIPHYAVISN